MQVGAVGVFGDESFPALAAGASVQSFAVFVVMVGKAQRIAEIKLAAQQLFARAQCQCGDVVAVKIKQIEQIQPDLDVARACLLRVMYADASLQPREAGGVAFKGNDLAVNNIVPSSTVPAPYSPSGMVPSKSA